MPGRSTLLPWIGIALSAILLASCGGKSETAPEHGILPASQSPLEKARAHQLGRGVPRDYRAAVEIYRTACHDGRGDVTAWGALMLSQLRDRGVAFDQHATI